MVMCVPLPQIAASMSTGSYGFTNIAVGTYTRTVFNYDTCGVPILHPYLEKEAGDIPPHLF